MKKYKVNVEGEIFEVGIEEMEAGNKSSEPVTTTVEESSPQPEPSSTNVLDDTDGEEVEAAVQVL